MVLKNTVAIVGCACRFPAASNPDDFWKILTEGRDVVSTIPPERWNQSSFFHPDKAEPGRSYTFSAGVLGDLSGFDAAFFGISPREAEQIDPQQRLLLELTWEALEQGGQRPSTLAGTDTAVFVGISGMDYSNARQDDPSSANAYFMLGSTLSIAANRISFCFDFNGPSMAIDTACSSGMMAMHEAFQAVQSGRVPQAVVGSVNLLLSPYPFIGFSKASMLSNYGRCRAFDKLAAGYVRAEGGGVLVLKPLAQAQRDGDRILAIVRGADTNCDGHTSGIALPSSERQEALLRQVYQRFGVDPAAVSYIEAHGTGTAVGDPAEAGAIGRAIGCHRPAGRPLPIGSVKSNIGHLEPASGMAGMIKALLMLKHGQIPRSLHIETPNPDIDFEGMNLTLARALAPLPRHDDHPAVIGINSFGFGGANVHVILEEYPQPAPATTPPQPGQSEPPLVLSARSEPALRAMAGQIADLLERTSPPAWYDLAHTTALRRDHHDHRLVVHAGDAIPHLRQFSETGRDERIVSGKVVSPTRRRVGFVFSGNGAQFAGMGRSLLVQDPVFRAEVDRIDTLIQQIAGWSVIAEMQADPENSRLADTEVAQPLLFAFQAGLVASLAARGLVAEAVTGHSVGEVAAAYCAGALTLDQAVKLILTRSAVQGRTKGLGRMAAVELPPSGDIASYLAPLAGQVEIAAYNSPHGLTLSGETDPLLALTDRLTGDGLTVRVLKLDYAFHSHLLDPVREDLLVGLANLQPAPARVEIHSTVLGARIDGERLDAEYWWRNLREPVYFREAITRMAEEGVSVFVEIGPHPIMQSYVRQTLRASNQPGQVMFVTSNKSGEAERVSLAVDRAYTLGAPIAFSQLLPRPGAPVDLPPYPWQRERFWHPHTPEARGPLWQQDEGSLLGTRVIPDQPLWERQIDAALFPFLADHVVGGAVLFPATGFLEVLIEAATCLFPGEQADIEAFEISRPLVLDPGRSKMMRVTWSAAESKLRIESRTRMQDEPWLLHVVARLSRPGYLPAPAPLPTCPNTAVTVEAEAHYALARRIGLDYGPCFQTVSTVAIDDDTAWVELTIPDGIIDGFDRFRLHPALIDGCLQGLFDLAASRLGNHRPLAYLPVRFQRFLLYPVIGLAVRCGIRLVRAGTRSLVADFTVIDSEGRVLAEIHGFRFQRAALKRSSEGTTPLYVERSHPLPPVMAFAVPKQAVAAARTALFPPPAINPLTADFDRLAAQQARQAVMALGLDPAMSPIEAAALVHLDLDRFGLLSRVLELAARPEAGTDGNDPDATWRRTLASHLDALAELTLLGRSASALPALLRGEQLDGTAPTAATLAHFHEASPTLAAGADAVADATARFAAAWPPGRRLAILEVGAGAGGLTRRLLGVLPPGDFDLVVSDIDENALDHLRAEFADRPEVRVCRIDLMMAEAARDELPQPGGVDLVVGHGILHVAASTAMALDGIAHLVRPGGAVVISEPAPAAWLDLAFGGTSSWWRMRDDGTWSGRPLSAEELTQAATAAALDEAMVAPVAGALVLAARRPESESAPDFATPIAGGAPWLIVAGTAETAHAEALVEALTSLGSAAQIVMDPPDQPEGWAAIWNETPAGVIDLGGLGENADPETGPLALANRRGWSLLAAAQGWTPREGDTRRPTLILVTREAMSDGTARPEQAVPWGVGRVVRNERPEIDLRQIDLDADAGIIDLAREIVLGAATGGESEVRLGAGRRFGFRVERLDLAEDTVAAGDSSTPTLTFTPGSLDHLRWKSKARIAPAAGEVEIEVRATGLNFRDVMFAMGLLPEEAVEAGFAGATIGMEGSGVITRVGAEVKDLTVGQRVLFFAPSCFSGHVTTRTTAVAPIPTALSFAEAATVPTVFFTVYYALAHLARLGRGDRILIHAAAGGVGMAAIQYARHVGAEIYATAGSPEKRSIVALLGVPADHIMDSRSTAFADQVMAMTGGEGVDVVLNSLAGEAIHKSLAVLRPFGSFLELGKRDFYADSSIGLRPFRNNLSYFGIDADQLLEARPDLARRLFGEVIALFTQGVFHPLPFREFTAPRAIEAFRHMQQARHTGKIVVLPPLQREETPVAISRSPFPLDPTACYLVTGGLGGFGLSTAQWLAEKGARSLVLVSRRGTAQDGPEQETVTALRDAGVRVDERACDVSDPAQVAALVSEIAAGPSPLKGLIHAAACFDDGAVEAMTPERLHRVLAPKLTGAWALHQATLDVPLDFFVVYSSVTTLFGNPGQSNYVAANLALERLIVARRAAGQPALAVGWGPIGDAGYLTRNVTVAETLEQRMGVRLLKSAQAFVWLERLLERPGPAVVTVADLDWRTLRGGLPALTAPRFRAVVGAGSEDSVGDSIDFRALAASMPPEELQKFLTELLAEQIGHVLRLSADKVEIERPIFDMGMDSLMALELRMQIEEKTGIQLSAMAITPDTTIMKLAGYLREHLLGTGATETTVETGMVTELLRSHAVDTGAEDISEVVEDLETKLAEGAKLLS
ncbi:type I polyketide synthase [Magnetospirillum molischianum]|uniref:Capsular polysaccharide biosynthesis fatty acid synthase n=1 Tax=Magnetospirillum molischianum DSM 120 TaxID=1150626 RepID=H8FX08_MAGML|nr:type I polyketide synthase [Magnetospirillum molischianum]CCG42896.1 Capsular polysaccharide biosynthesis fatty acid synthase [Magnetospirillum molischianum DSM 120]